MERFSLILVCWATMCLLVHFSDGSKNDSKHLWTLYFKDLGVRVHNDVIIGKTGTPTLYNLLKETNYKDTLNDESEKTFSFEAIATGNLLCMNRVGCFYTMKETIWKRQQRRIFGKSPKALVPPADCLFRSKPLMVIYSKFHVIYSAAHSNSTVGRFISITANGTIRSYRSSFEQLDDNPRIRMNLNPITHWDSIVQNTVFYIPISTNRKRIKMVQNCIRNRWSPANLNKRRHPSLKKVIDVCKKLIKKRLRPIAKL